MKQTLVNFVPDMVPAINEDRKTQARRICKNEIRSNGQSFNKITGHINCMIDELPPSAELMKVNIDGFTEWLVDGWEQFCPIGQPGDRIGVRERARVLGYPEPGKARICYEADGEEAVVPWPSRIRPVIIGKCIPNGCHREAVRTWLEITAVRVERLNEISEEDAKAEGSPWGIHLDVLVGKPTWREGMRRSEAFKLLWESVYGTGTFDDRWVWVVEFRRVEGGAS